MYPAAPWQLTGQLWMSLFRLAEPVDDLRPAGTYAAAFVSYEPGSVLTYSELLVARALRTGPRGSGAGIGVSITDIWVDSPDSMAGGRALWAIPKDLADFELETVRRGPLTTTEWSSRTGRRPVAEARFTDLSRASVRLPFRGRTSQPGIAETHGEERSATLRGSAKVLPCRGRWELAPDGPLGWLRGGRRLGSFRMADFSMDFG